MPSETETIKRQFSELHGVPRLSSRARGCTRTDYGRGNSHVENHLTPPPIPFGSPTFREPLSGISWKSPVHVFPFSARLLLCARVAILDTWSVPNDSNICCPLTSTDVWSDIGNQGKRSSKNAIFPSKKQIPGSILIFIHEPRVSGNSGYLNFLRQNLMES